MAFWGIGVKPGKPFTHKFDDSKGRLHISMASLGFGNATVKSVLQCNVGNKSPVFLCSLYPEKTESLQLNLEFEEVDDVVFSVIGPRSIHLSGYHLSGGGRYHALNEESESYGEDIADTDTQRSDCSDEEYDDSFINDGEPEVFPPSPASSDGKESLDNKKPRIGKSNHRRQLRKKYQVSDSDDEGCSRKKNTANGSSIFPRLESEDEDKLPISSCLKGGVIAKEGVQDGETNAGTGIDEGSLPTRKSDFPVEKLLSSDVGHKDGGTPKKKRKERSTEDKSRESDRDKDDKILQDEVKVDSKGLELMAEDGEKPKTVNDSDLPHENDEGPKKKKRKMRKNEKKTVDVDNSHVMNVVKENNDWQDEAKDASIIQDLSVKSEQNEKLATEQNNSEEKKVKKKKKKKSKAQENREADDTDKPLLPVEEKNTSSINMYSKKPDAKASQVRTLQSGLVVEEVESGKTDGKVASSGKKISVHYVGKLKKNGEMIDSNIGGAPYKFRLGAGKVLEGWEVGLEGMRVGEKRRLTVPPSMAYGSEGDGEKIPPNSWLVYEIELFKVH